MRQTDRSKLFAARRLGVFSQRKCPIILREHSSRVSLRWFTRTAISVSSSSVREIFCSLSTKSLSMVTTTAEWCKEVSPTVRRSTPTKRREKSLVQHTILTVKQVRFQFLDVRAFASSM